MKIRKSIKVALIVLMSLSACKKSGFLDNKSTTTLNEEIVFSDSTNTMNFLGRIYEDSGFSFYKLRYQVGSTEIATDDADPTGINNTDAGTILRTGTYSPINFPMIDFWSTPYKDIRRVNLLLSKLSKTPLSDATQRRVSAEARFLRAWYYQKLVCSFGGVPLIGDQLFQPEDIINIPRSSYGECVEYIVTELDAAAKALPTVAQYSSSDYGRATQGACLALKSRVLLFSASPLFNGGSLTTDPNLAKIISYPTYDVDHWQKAADAAMDVMNLNQYNLELDNTTAPGYGFYNVFLKRVNSEYIFAFYRAQNKDFESVYNPISRGGNKYIMPTQQLVDAFPMNNGKAITDPASGYNADNPYVKRDPRFHYSIIYNGSNYYNNTTATQVPINTYEGAPSDGYPITLTGYYSRKMCDSTIAANSSATTQRDWPLIRYAEILLNYAEAINETGQTTLAYAPLITLRNRAGIIAGSDGLYGLKANMTQAEMRGIVRNERRVELMFEDQRWDDIRRWKIAVEVNNGANKAMKITKSGTTFIYQIVNVVGLLHATTTANFLLPIPQSEISRMPALLQNPGY
jgi:hypothetical protein